MKLVKNPVFEPLYQRDKLFYALYGGRGGGKSWEIADYLLIDGVRSVNRVLCCREIQKSIKQSVHQLLKDRITALGLGGHYEVLNTEIKGKNGTLFSYTGLQEHTKDSMKSYEGYNRTWIEEAQSVSAGSLEILIPTVVRRPDSQIIFSLNPKLASDPVYKDYVATQRPDTCRINVNYWQNKHCPAELKRLAEEMKQEDYDNWLHIYAGQPKLIADGAIYKKELSKLRQDGRLTSVPPDPALPVHTVWDLGIGDSTAIWFVQIYGKEVRLIDYYEAYGEGLPHYARILTDKHYNYGKHFAPHDIKVRELGSGVSRLETARKLGINFEVVAQMRVEDGIDAARMLLGTCWVDEQRCERGMECLQNYRREYDENLLDYKPKPVHDWASHAADAFRYLAIAVESMMPKPPRRRPKQKKRPTGWMG